ncbi:MULTISPECIES: MmgE/PrpD family protein [unclassified Pseudomonas]|uniref:MmgE/PrpD family protein n=1 Tax=unclassified Pseudomonas TaxID=196821 RepID=UPI0015A06DDF|nr:MULTISPECIES: MmgE/PrpD family protein [unclassified Pseudomonas]NWC92589.1 MmgE/PrpD family protein [Pseudomonas sp. IPO3779]NWD15587.1 MmgE/PrpD family protein [Pseudomonas sp. IPO3778]
MSDLTPTLVALSRWSSTVRLAQVPPAVRHAAKRCLIDTLGVTLAGSHSDVATQARTISLAVSAAGHSGLPGHVQRLSAPAAAFVNATAGHALDFDDNCYPGVVHGSVVILPAALAVAQMRDLDGAALLTAFVVGAECEYALAKALTGQLYERRWWTTGLLGVVGACAAACHALGLDAERTASALGIALCTTAAMKAGFGTDAKALMAGRTSEAGVMAALLAEQGSRGPVDLVEHANGLAAMFNAGVLKALPLPGVHWSLLDPGVDIKRLPLCLSSHAAVDALKDMLESGAVAVTEIADILCDVPPIVIQNLTHALPTQRQQAQFSMPFAMAGTCLLGDITLAALTPQTINRPDMQRLMQRVRMHSSERWNTALMEQAPEGAWVKVVRTDGSCVERFCARPLGSAANPLSQAQLRDKFMACATLAMPAAQAQALLEHLEQLERIPRVRHLLPDSHALEQSDS